MLLLGQPGFFHQSQRQGDEARHQHRVQDKNAQVQAQQVRMLERRDQCLARDTGLTVLQRTSGARHHEHHDHDAEQRHAARGEEQPGQSEGPGQQRANDHGHRKRQADGHADHGHGLGPVLLTGQV
ncbi:hypothetical protein D3C87_1455260 [compost metagenome]